MEDGSKFLHFYVGTSRSQYTKSFFSFRLRYFCGLHFTINRNNEEGVNLSQRSLFP